MARKPLETEDFQPFSLQTAGGRAGGGEMRGEERGEKEGGGGGGGGVRRDWGGAKIL